MYKRQENSDYHSLAEYYDPLGYSVWGYMQSGIVNALTKYLSLSISLGIATAIAYVVITNQKMKPILKLDVYKRQVIIPVNKQVPISFVIAISKYSNTTIKVCAQAGEAGSTKL